MLQKKKFTLSYHFSTQDRLQNHLDLFIMQENSSLLETWSLGVTKPRQEKNWQRKPDHRQMYLHYQGEVSKNRGKIRILKTGYLEDHRSITEQNLKITCHDGCISLH